MLKTQFFKYPDSENHAKIYSLNMGHMKDKRRQIDSYSNARPWRPLKRVDKSNFDDLLIDSRKNA